MMRGLIGGRPEEKKRTCGPKKQHFLLKLTFVLLCLTFFFFFFSLKDIKGKKDKKENLWALLFRPVRPEDSESDNY